MGVYLEMGRNSSAVDGSWKNAVLGCEMRMVRG